MKIFIFESSHGVLEIGDPTLDKIPKGYYLSRAYSHHEGGAIKSIESSLDFHLFQNASEAQNNIKNMSLSANWLVTDNQNNIIYQQSGLVPLRKHSGLYPVLGWKKTFDWQGYVKPEDLTSIENPFFGFISTANDDWNTEGNAITINLHLGPYRRDRIDSLLRRKQKYNLEDMKRIQQDLVSVKAIRYMKIFSQLINPKLNNASYEIMKWDFKYDSNSKGAVIFEAIYKEILRDVFSRVFPNWNRISESRLTREFSHYLDNIIFEYPKSLNGILWKGESRNEMFKRVLNKVLPKLKAKKTYGMIKKTYIYNTFFKPLFSGTFGTILGIHNVLTVQGSTSTVAQGILFKNEFGEDVVIGQSYRMVIDMKSDSMETSLPGGTSENIFSKYYSFDLSNWKKGLYKKLNPNFNQ